MKFLILTAIFGGEFIGVFLEIFLANRFREKGTFPEMITSLAFFIPLFILSFLLLLFGYIYGFRSYQKIWIITIVSWSSIVLIEPLLNYFILKEIPSGNTLIAGVLAFLAIMISIF